MGGGSLGLCGGYIAEWKRKWKLLYDLGFRVSLGHSTAQYQLPQSVRREDDLGFRDDPRV